MTSSDQDRLARIAYEAHRGANPGSLPRWEDATEQEKKAWRVVVSAVSSAGEVTVVEGASVPSIVVQVNKETQTFHKEFTAGRQGSLVISDEHASGQHCLFQPAHGLWYVKDLGSTNGTWVNGRRVVATQRLKKGDKVKIGRTFIVIAST